MPTNDWTKPLPPPGGAVHRIPDFFVYRQLTDHTCGPACVRMALLSLGVDVPEDKIARSCLTLPMGTLQFPLLLGYRHYLRRTEYTVDMAEDAPDIYETIVGEAREGRPVVFIFACEDDFHPGRKCTHYGVVIGIDEPAGTIAVANPFGMIRDVPIAEWWDSFSLLPDMLPPYYDMFIKLGLLKPRTAFVLKKKNQ